MAETGFLSSSVRPGHPDFLDLPWDLPLSEWPGRCPRLEELPRGLSRHVVVFVNYGSALYALKELPPESAEKEYDLLRRMEDMNLPVVAPVGHVQTRTREGGASVLITVYLDHSVPYHALFMQRNMARQREYLLDAMSSLLVQLHLAGIYWGDCSLSNTLFRRDAGALQAYFVDAETSEIKPSLTDRMRTYDLDIMQENVQGELMDLAAMENFTPEFRVGKIGAYIRLRYQNLWNEITREEIMGPGQRYRIRERIQKLNELGFSVDEMEILPAQNGNLLRMRAFVTDRNFHRDLLHTLTGVSASDHQARQMVNEIRELKATLSEENQRSTPLSVAAYHWFNQVYMPSIQSLRPFIDKKTDIPELYCQMLEHKWYLSEQAREDVGHKAAVESYLKILQEKKSR